MPIKYHEKPTAAPSEYSAICRAVGLGNIAAELLDATEPAPTLRRFYDKASQWFAIDEGTADEVLRAITVAAREVARFLAVPAGSAPDTEAILALAREQLATMTIPADDPPDELPTQLSDADVPSRDELTGVSSRARFDQTLIAAFEQAKSARTPLGVAVFEIDQLRKVTGEIGRDSGDNVLVVIAGRLDRVLRNAQTLVARYDEDRIAVVMPRTSRVDAVRACEAARLAVAGSPVRLVTAPYGAPPSVEVTVSVGLAVVDTGTIERFEDVSALLMIVEQAVKAAKKAGCNAIRVYAPTVAAPAA